MLKINNLSVNYGVIEAVRDISLEINDNEIVSLIGANGAGKTTTLHAISHLLKYHGNIYLDDKCLDRVSAEDLVKLGIIQVPEGRKIFSSLTVEENLMIGSYLRKDKEQINEDLKEIYSLFPILEKRKKQFGQTLSGGEQQMLAIGRALMSKPKILLLDEPSMGLSPLLVKEIFNIILKINKDKNVSILLVEQNAKMALNISNRAYVLENGKIILSGTGNELINNKDVINAYLGGSNVR